MSTLMRVLRALGLQSTGGLVVWAIVAIAAMALDSAALDIVTVLLLFGQLVVVPMGLLLLDDGTSGAQRWLLSGGRFLFRVGAVAAIASVALPAGELSAAIAALYLLPATLVGAASLLRAVDGLRDGSLWRAGELARVAAGGFLFIGALFFVFHRQGFTFAGFHELIIQLTAVHFHFTGFGLMLMAAEVARRRPRFGAVVYLLLGAMLVTPIGFLTCSWLQPAGALLVVAALALIAIGTLTVLGGLRPSARRMLFVSSIFPIVVGWLAAAYAIAEATGAALIPLSAMAALHGTFAAIGVVFCGLLGWRLASDR